MCKYYLNETQLTVHAHQNHTDSVFLNINDKACNTSWKNK